MVFAASCDRVPRRRRSSARPRRCTGVLVLRVLALPGAVVVLQHSVLAETPAAAATPPPASQPGIVLYETHTQSQVAEVDTIVTYVTARRVRVSHPSGHTILDLVRDRIVLLNPAEKTYKEMPLQEWEARVDSAVGGTGSGESGESFEKVEGETSIAGNACDRYHYYGKRTILGAEELVEQQIWIARNLEVPAAGYEAYRRALESIESIGSGRLRRRPEGIVLGVETRVQRAGDRRSAVTEIESNTVFRVEKKDLPDALFTVPTGFVRADSATTGADTGAAPRGAR